MNVFRYNLLSSLIFLGNAMWLTKPALESIAFQDGAFFSELVKIIETSRAENNHIVDPKILVKTKAAQTLKDTINKYTGLYVDFSYMGDYACLPPPINPSHILYDGNKNKDRAILEYLDILIKETKLKKEEAWIDLKTGKVGGYFSKLPTLIVLPAELYNGLSYKQVYLTAEECAAILLHEIGHALSYFELLLRFSTTNQVLASLLSDNQKVIKMTIKAAANIYNLSEKEKEIIENSKTNDDAVIFIVAAADRQARSDFGVGLFDTNAWEQLSDQYTVRQGAGKYLLSAMEKRSPYKTLRHFRATKDYYLQALFGALNVLGVLIATHPLITAAMILLQIVDVYAKTEKHAIEYNTNQNKLNRLYGDDKTRFTRIYQDMINALKDSSLPADKIKEMVSDLEKSKQIVEKYSEVKGPWHYTSYLFSSLYRRNYDFVVLQKQLEGLASNPLFVSAAKLKVLAQ
jgi:hypothetical protein